jgi:EAL domain-containing protein (putative c-di-GMP-specific phosphodiesterase class I)/FixJ family two-component response regulator
MDVDKAAIRILVLDDEPFMLKLLAHMLTGLGFASVTTCDSGAEALSWVDSPGNPGDAIAPNLILLDLNMPQMDGIEFVRKLVGHGYDGSVVLVSGEDERVLQMAEKLVAAHQLTLLGHLNKPVSLAGLERVLGRWRPAVRRSVRRVYGADELRVALAYKRLVNHYQPKVAIAGGAVVGMETLVRWQHPEDGLVLPDQFIGVAEEHGLIDELTRTVMTGAFAQARLWHQAGLRLKVAINISMDNLSSVEFADFVAGAASSARVIPQDIVLELTESRLLLDQRAPLEILTRLRLKRFRLSIDDFGTGHASLTQLHDIPFDELKIDRSFVHGACGDETALSMYYVCMALGEQLGMEVVAEGVEDLDDWRLVQRTGCDLAQGDFIARPMPADEVAGWIAAWNERAPAICGGGEAFRGSGASRDASPA